VRRPPEHLPETPLEPSPQTAWAIELRTPAGRALACEPRAALAACIRSMDCSAMRNRHHLAHAGGLILERGGRGGGLFDQCRVLLRDFIHLRDGAIDLFDPPALLFRRRSDFAHDVRHALHRRDQFRHGRTGFRHEARAARDAIDGFSDQLLDFLGCRRATLRQATHLARDDREASPLFARTCCFHSRIERENIRLECDAFDHTDDVGHLA
jgi:hypothetical protein